MGNFEILEDLSLSKSNALISAKYRSTLVENQIMAIALTRIESRLKGGSGELVAKLYPGELRRLISDENNIYYTLKKVANMMTGHTMFIEDGKGNFRAHAIVKDAEYENGVFTIAFNEKLKDHVIGLEKNYTSLELSILAGFKKNSAFRIYELLKSHVYKSRKDVNGGCVDVEYNISELRFMIGLANGDDPNIKNHMARMGKNVDWDLLYGKLAPNDRKYEKWYDFQRYVLKPAQKELEEKSNIRFEYEGKRSGHKMYTVVFHIYPNKPSNPNEIDARRDFIEAYAADNRQLERPFDIYPDLYDKYIGHNDLTKADIDMLMSKAGFDIEKVIKAIEMADKQDHLTNYVGWIVRCIENNYVAVETIDGSADAARRVSVVTDNYQKALQTGEVQRSAWARIKTKDDYPAFCRMIEDKGLSIEQLEQIYDDTERAQMYTDWRVGRDVVF